MTYRCPKIALLTTGIILFFASLAGYVVFTYHSTHFNIMQDIDNRLLKAAKTSNIILGKNYHKNLSHIDSSTYQKNSAKLSELATTLGVEYVYTMIYDPPHVRFTSSSYTLKDIENKKITYFLDVYSDATATNIKAFQSTEALFEISKDEWGTFKSVFIPFITDEGLVYLAGADITINDVQLQLEQSIRQAILTGCFFFFIAVLVSGLYLLFKKNTFITDSRTGFANRTALEQVLENNKTTHLTLAIICVEEYEEICNFYGSSVGEQIIFNAMQFFKYASSSYKVYILDPGKFAVLSYARYEDNELYSLIHEFNDTNPILNVPSLHLQIHAGLAHGNKSLLLENTFIAYRQAKKQKVLICLFSNLHQTTLNEQHEHLEIAKLLEKACKDNEMILYFEPVFSTHSQSISHYACSARLKDAHNKLIKGKTLEDVVKQSRLSRQLHQVLLKTCFSYFKKNKHTWSIKLDVVNFLAPKLQHYIYQQIRLAPSPSAIIFEFNELDVLTHLDAIRPHINTLSNMGVKVIIHSVSSGLYTVSKIMTLNIYGISLAHDTVDKMDLNLQVLDFIQQQLKLCNSRKIKLLVTKVDKQQHFLALTEIGLDFLQGKFIAEPSAKTEGFRNKIIALSE